MNLSDITDGELLWLWRHRQRYRLRGYSRMSREFRRGSAFSIDAMAFELRIGRKRYLDMENDRVPVNGLVQLRSKDVELGELCHLARRRSGLTVIEICDDLAVSAPKFYELEAAGDPVIVGYWHDLGFRFPNG